ncbi:MAG: transglutaminase domain-containing protein [Lachnospiraceae bacterium]|nr:transglutaminase domain-containing protein [Lachnospiraceae bacterium]
MKNICTNGKKFLILFGLAVLLLLCEYVPVHAMEKAVMKITVKDSYQTQTGYVNYQKGDENTGLCDYFDFSEIHILDDDKNLTAEVSVEVLDKNLILEDTLQYNKTISINDDLDLGLSFRYNDSWRGLQSFDSNYGGIETFKLYGSIDNMYVSTTSKGFNPSKGNYIKVYGLINHETASSGDVFDWRLSNLSNDSDIKTKIYVNVLNIDGKYVYRKTYKNKDYDLYNYFVNLNWDGKASKGNSAGVKAGKYVSAGNYYVEIRETMSVFGYTKTFSEKRNLKVSKTAPKGTKGVMKANNIPVLTGISEIDYMAEQMCKSAGIKSSMSDEQKIKKIYHYMTKNFKHLHDNSKRKKYYKLDKLKSKIKAYKVKTDEKAASGKMMYSYLEYSDHFGLIKRSMVKRSGVCDDHAVIFMILCNHVGIDAGRSSGYYKNSNGTLAPHAWNYAVINGKTYYYDVDIEIQNYKKGQGDYYWYKKTLNQAKKNHKFTNYSY